MREELGLVPVIKMKIGNLTKCREMYLQRTMLDDLLTRWTYHHLILRCVQACTCKVHDSIAQSMMKNLNLK